MGGSGISPAEHGGPDPLLEGRRLLLEQLAQGRSSADLLDFLCRWVESRAGQAICSVLVIGEDGRTLRHGAGPGLPAGFVQALDGKPDAGIFSAAALENRTAVAQDIAKEPRWDDFRALALAHALAACAAIPIQGPDGAVLGVFALYHREPGPFESAEMALLEAAAELAAAVLRIQQGDQFLRQREARYRHLFDVIPDPVWIFDPRTLGFVEVNQAAADLYGWTKDEFQRKSLEDIWTPETRLEARARLAALGPDEVLRGKFQHRTRAGALIDVEVTSQPIELGGRGLRFTLVRDITESRRTEAALEASEARYRAVVEQAGEMIFFFEVTTKRIVEANDAFQLTLGYGAGDLETLTLYDLVEADRESVDRNVAHVVSEQYYHVGRRRYRHKDGRIREVEVSANHLKEIHQDLLCAVARDVTDQVRAEAAMRQAQKLESLGLLAGGVAHDFNNMLTAILGNLNLAQMNLPKASPSLAYLGHIEGTVLRAADLTRQMLTYSGKGRFLIQAVDLGRLVDEMTHLLMASISKKVLLHSQVPEALPALEGDPAQIQQIVMNLVLNASEAIGDSEGTIGISACASDLDEAFIASHLPRQAVDAGPHVIFEVSDTGIGMSPETMSRIFDPFFTTKVSGRGLGLSAMLGILRSHHAGINIYSELGKGSTFRIYFPAHQAVEKTLEPAPPPARPAFPPGTVLVVDDESTIRATAGAMLESLGFQVLEAADGIQAVEIYQAQGTDILLVLLDLTMPRMDGKATFQAIQELNPSAKVILSSGYNREEALHPFTGADPAGFLRKPYQYKDLLTELARILLSPP
ncbi:MAG: PAS domain S-box protein [Holophagaceae bacterium]|nr:PAS domain S-box protein [Holophagaceae bacterium]